VALCKYGPGRELAHREAHVGVASTIAALAHELAHGDFRIAVRPRTRVITADLHRDRLVHFAQQRSPLIERVGSWARGQRVAQQPLDRVGGLRDAPRPVDREGLLVVAEGSTLPAWVVS
jgi:hypothetical protein